MSGICWWFNPQTFLHDAGQAAIQNRMDRLQQGNRPIRLGHERIYGLQSIVRQVHVPREHDDWDLRFHLLDGSRHDPAIQKIQLVVEHNCIDGLGHEKLQALVAIGCGHQFVAVFLQQTKFRRIFMDAE